MAQMSAELEVQRQEEKLAFSKTKQDRMKARDQLSQATQTIAQIEKNFYDREESDDAEDLEESDENMDENATMKKYFTKSAVYKRFKAEEEKELAQLDQAEIEEQELVKMQKDYDALQKKVSAMEFNVKHEEQVNESLAK